MKKSGALYTDAPDFFMLCRTAFLLKNRLNDMIKN